MGEPFIGEIRMFAGKFAPRGWAFCDGRLIRVQQQQALYSLLGNTYGGDVREPTFALPDMRGRVPMGQDPKRHPTGERAGSETVQLTEYDLPSHRHTLMGSRDPADSGNPAGKLPAVAQAACYGTGDGSYMNSDMIAPAGEKPHDNLQPFLCVHFIIAMMGIYPPRSW